MDRPGPAQTGLRGGGRGPRRARRLVAGLLLAGCAAAGPAAGRVVILPEQAADPAAAQTVAARARGAHVLYLGEDHDNPHHHAAQAQILAALLAGGARPAVGFEMLAETQQELLERAVAESRSAAEAAARLGWRERGWPDFAMYWPLFELARRHELPVVALDLDPALARRIGREGLAAAGPRQAELTSRLPPDPAREAAVARTIQTAHCDLLPPERVPRMVESWHARNVTMARRLATALARADLVVVIIGRGHQDPGGVPDQLAALRPETRQVVVALLEVGPGETPEAVAARARGDVLWLTPRVERGDPCEGLRRQFRRPASG